MAEFGLRFRIDPTEAKAGRDEVVRALRDIGQAHTQLQGQLGAESRSVNEVIQAHRDMAAAKRQAGAADQELAAKTQYLIQQLIRQGYTAELAAEAIKQMDVAAVKLPPSLEKAADKTEQLSRSQDRIRQAGEKSVPGLSRLANSYEALAAQALGTNPALLKTASVLSGLSSSATLTIGVTSGLALIALAYQGVTKTARETEKAVEDATKSIEDQARRAGQAAVRYSLLAEGAASAGRRSALSQQLGQLGRFATFQGLYTGSEMAAERQAKALQAEANARFAAVLRGREHLQVLSDLAGSFAALIQAGEADANVMARSKDIMAQAREVLADTNAALQDRITALGIIKTLEGDTERKANERQRQLQTVQDAELKALRDRARLLKDVATEESVIRAQERVARDRAIEAAKELNQSERARLRTALELQDAIAGQTREMERLAAANKRILDDWSARQGDREMVFGAFAEAARERRDRWGRTLTLQPGGSVLSNDQIEEMRQRGRDQLAKDAEASLKAMEDADRKFWESHANNAVRSAQAIREVFLDVWTDIFIHGLKGGDALFAALQQGATRATKALQGIIDRKADRRENYALESYIGGITAGIGTGLGFGSATRNPALGLLGGGVSGFLAGGPVGAIAGGLAGLFGGLFGGGPSKEERERFKAASQSFYDQGAARSPVNGALKALRDQFEELRKEAERLKEPIGKLTASYSQQRARILAQHADEQRVYQEDMRVRQLVAQEKDEEAARERLRLNQDRELQEAQKKGYDGVTLSILKHTQILEAERLEREIAAAKAAEALAALDKELSAGISNQGLEVRRAQLGVRRAGSSLDSAGRAAQEDLIREQSRIAFLEADKQRQLGQITEEYFRSLVNLINEEMEQSLAEIEQAIAKFNQNTQEDLAVEALGLRAQITGDTADEAAWRESERRLRNRREVEEAIARGADEATLALIAHNQALREGAEAAAEARRAAEEAIRWQKEETRATEDLTIRHLRATQGDQAAGEAAAFYAAQREIATAIEEKRSQEYIEFLRQVQNEERLKRDEDRRRQQQEAFDAAFPTVSEQAIAASATSVNLAVGVSETTAGMLRGTLASHTPLLMPIPNIDRTLLRIERLLTRMAESSGGRGLDEVLADWDSEAERVAGNPPSNR